MKFTKTLISILFWLRIFAAPFLVFLIISFLAGRYFQSSLGTVISIVVIIIGILTSTIITERIRRKHGAVSFMSRVIASPELDSKSEGREHDDTSNK